MLTEDAVKMLYLWESNSDLV